ncbi:hypothetical protein Vafri_12634 [Volvox africanus]|uniref:ELYS-like domain-containing protein n=1 Tax=Volvox africanus TaxID=51714 RepID=A0A8J4F2U2_9CHLO|nr:hypothetical protein Vafri_12634 [Volvox africanus]
MAPTATAAVSYSLLDVLSSCSLKELHLKRADGNRIMDSLYKTCITKKLIPSSNPAGNSYQCYVAVFDAALNGGLGLWILDYVEVVCADRYLTSSDPLEAQLLDGGFVKDWAQGRLKRAEEVIDAALGSDAALSTFQSSQLQQQLAQMRVLVSVLRSLDRIRTIAAGGMWATTSTSPVASLGAVTDRLSVKGDLQRAILLEQALQVVDWFARQRLLGPGSNPGRFGAHMEWRRLVSRRTAKASHRRIFLEELLQSLELRSSYPEISKAQMLKSVLLKSRDVDSTTWTTKLALLVYYLMDAALLDSGPGQGGPWGPRFQDAVEDMRRTFRLSAADLGVWQCYFLLDCASPASTEAEDPFLARACALLPSHVAEDTPFPFIEVLLALDRPDVALSLDRGQSEWGPGGATTAPASTSGRCGRSLEQTLTLMDVRLRCGLMTDALMLLRQHTADLVARGKSETEVRRQTRVLLRHLAEWTKDADKVAGMPEAAGPDVTGGGGWLNRLTELPLNVIEEFVLLEWLVEQMRTPIGAFAPLFFLQRGRIAEGVSAWSKCVSDAVGGPFSTYKVLGLGSHHKVSDSLHSLHSRPMCRVEEVTTQVQEQRHCRPSAALHTIPTPIHHKYLSPLLSNLHNTTLPCLCFQLLLLFLIIHPQ